MTYKLLRHKDFTAEWEKLPVAIRDQFKKKLAKVIEQPHIPKNMLRGDLAGCYKIKLLKAGVRLVYQVKDEPYRVCRRLNILRDYSDEKTKLYPRN